MITLIYDDLSPIARREVHRAYVDSTGGIIPDGRVKGKLITGGWIEMGALKYGGWGWTLTPDGIEAYRTAMHTHEAAHAPASAESAAPTCQYCGRTFSTQDLVWKHIEFAHTAEAIASAAPADTPRGAYYPDSVNFRAETATTCRHGNAHDRCEECTPHAVELLQGTLDTYVNSLDAVIAERDQLRAALEAYIKADVSGILELAHYYAPGELGEAQDRMEREILAYMNARIISAQVLPEAHRALAAADKETN